MIWEIKYKNVGDNNIKTIKKDLNFTKKHEVSKWFDKNKNNVNSGIRYFEFISAKPL